MTHDELLKTVETDQELTKYLDKGLVSGDITINTARQHWFQSNALRAVVGLAKPSEYDSTDAVYWKQEILKAIEKELQ